jgi:hypothetical protein
MRKLGFALAVSAAAGVAGSGCGSEAESVPPVVLAGPGAGVAPASFVSKLPSSYPSSFVDAKGRTWTLRRLLTAYADPTDNLGKVPPSGFSNMSPDELDSLSDGELAERTRPIGRFGPAEYIGPVDVELARTARTWKSRERFALGKGSTGTSESLPGHQIGATSISNGAVTSAAGVDPFAFAVHSPDERFARPWTGNVPLEAFPELVRPEPGLTSPRQIIEVAPVRWTVTRFRRVA